MKIGEFDRGGKCRVFRKANDHDFNVIGKTTPVGFLIPKSDDLTLYMVSSSVTSDCLADLLQEWWDEKKTVPLGLINSFLIWIMAQSNKVTAHSL